MNYKMVFNTTAKVLRVEGILMILPLIVSLIYQEWLSALVFLIVGGGAFLVGCLAVLLIKVKNQLMFAKEGLIIVSLAWIVMSLVGSLPFVISGEIPNFIDAWFETVSGFTTTGASILTDVESLSHGMLFWRSFTHWVGGMGVLVFILAITSKSNDRSMHILRAEMPGPKVDKFVPRARKTSLILYLIYTAMTALLTIMLLFGGMDLFESLIHAFGTAGTGGFGINAQGLAGYSNYIQWVIAVFMLLFGINFNLYYLVIIGRVSSLFKSRELWAYLAIWLMATLTIALNIYSIYGNFADVLRISVFQTSAIITTTGFATVDFASWPAFSRTVLLLLMFTGGCAGSTAGGFKVSRVMILFKKIVNDLRKTLHPRTSTVVKFEGRRLDESTINGVTSYTTIYFIVLLIVFLLLSLDGGIANELAIETNFSAAVSCFNNIGPGLSAVGPMANYAVYSPFSKVVLSLAMLLGRLEIYPILLTLNIGTWIKR